MVISSQYSVLNLPTSLQSSLSLIGTILVLIPIYQFINNKSTLIQSTARSLFIPITFLNNKPIDTQICLLPEISSEMVSGLTNTGNTCFLNSVLQALSSLPQVQLFLDQSNKCSKNNLPITSSLLKTLRLLSTPINNIFKPVDIVKALKNNQQVINREQQDAQELYQLLISQLDDEINETNKSTAATATSDSDNQPLENPFNGSLTYNITCVNCGYSSDVPNQTFNSIQLNLPNTEATTLDDCLSQLTNMEYLTEVECTKCSILNTIKVMNNEITTNQNRELIKELEHKLQLNDMDDIKKYNIQKSNSSKTKQVKFSKPPKVLCLHFVRSIYLNSGDIVKNTCQVNFPSVLDLSPYSTVSTKYKLMSTIVHYGDHHSGHYIAYKRKISAEKCNCKKCESDEMMLKAHEDQWFKISDDRVMPCKTNDALQENPFMLMYELIDEPQPQPQPQPQLQQNDDIIEDEELDLDDLISNVPAAPPSSPVFTPLPYRKKLKHSNIIPLNNHHSIPILTQ